MRSLEDLWDDVILDCFVPEDPLSFPVGLGDTPELLLRL